MSKVKLIIKEEINNGEVSGWIENEKGEVVNIAPRECLKCMDPIWQGHVMNATENVYCTPCFEERFDKETIKQMHKEGEQYWTQWTEDDFDSEKYEVTKVPVV